jgi:hypothetical protein
MTRLSDKPEVVRLAEGLRLDWRTDAVGEIIRYCHKKIAGWLRGQAITSLSELEELVCRKLCLAFEEVWNDDDLKNIARKYVLLGEPVFGSLGAQLSDDTYAVLMERRRIDASSSDRYVAVVDCRGTKGSRRFFSRWHEIAHLLTLIRQLELPFHRSVRDESPIERLMDVIAGEIGFYDPIFRPALEAEVRAEEQLSFAGVNRLRESVCPSASFQATLIASASRASVPVIYLEAKVAYKKSEKAEIESRQLDLIPRDRPKPQLRAVVVVPNKAATCTGLLLHRNMLVPQESAISRYFAKTCGLETSDSEQAAEDLAIWKHSDGSVVCGERTVVEVCRIGDRVVSLITLAS